MGERGRETLIQSPWVSKSGATVPHVPLGAATKRGRGKRVMGAGSPSFSDAPARGGIRSSISRASDHRRYQVVARDLTRAWR